MLKNKKRIVEVSYQHKLSHLGSCLSAVDAIEAVYQVKKPKEKFILSNGHAGVALYTVLERHGLMKMPDHISVHPDRDECIDCSTGSLGQGLPIAVGRSLAKRDKNVYCMISDGECAVGSIWESLRIAGEVPLTNLKIIVNANGYSAYDEVDIDSLIPRFKAFGWEVLDVDGHNIDKIKSILRRERQGIPNIILARTRVDELPFLRGVHAHYHVMSDEDYQTARDYFNDQEAKA